MFSFGHCPNYLSLSLIDWEKPESYTKQSAPTSLGHSFLSWMVSQLSEKVHFVLFQHMRGQYFPLLPGSHIKYLGGAGLQHAKHTGAKIIGVQKMYGQKLQMCANMNMHICKIISTLLWLFDKLKGKFTMEEGNPFVPLALVFTFFLHCGLFLLKLFK